MPINEQFIPGQWIDTIDVNDFINLNKKPFLEEPFFLANMENTPSVAHYEEVKNVLRKEKLEIDLTFPSFEQEEIPWFHRDFTGNPLKRKIGFSENIQDMKTHYGLPSNHVRQESRKTTYQLFEEVVTSDIHKMIKMNLLTQVPTTHSPSFTQPDVRIVVLYGTKRLIKEKRWALKTLEKHLQTHEWMQRRISIHREIDAIKQFEKFVQKQGYDVSSPAKSAEEACTFLMLAIAGAMMENPSIPFSLSQALPFLDAYIEQELQSGKIAEEQAQTFIDTFYINLSFIRFSIPLGLAKDKQSEPFFLGETVGGDSVTKTTYRFLYSLRRFKLFPFSIRVLWNENLPAPFQSFIQDLVNDHIPISFYREDVYNRKETLAFYANGLHGVPSEDVMFDAGGCDLEKALYLSLNSGKDVATNSNIMPITQPVRQGDLHYDDVWGKFKDYISYILNSYAELMNLVLYLNEVHNNHPFRSSLMAYLVHYHIQFGFFHVEKVASLLTAIYEEEAIVTRDKKGWITNITPKNEDKSNPFIVSLLAELIQSELSKVPIYKGGNPTIKFYLDEINSTYSVAEIEEKQPIPAEMSRTVFPANVEETSYPDVFEFIRVQMDKGFREIHIQTKGKANVINGIWLEEQTKKDDV